MGILVLFTIHLRSHTYQTKRTGKEHNKRNNRKHSWNSTSAIIWRCTPWCCMSL